MALPNVTHRKPQCVCEDNWAIFLAVVHSGLVTGSAGFIASNFVIDWLAQNDDPISLDKLTYAGNLQNLASLGGDDRHVFVKGDTPLVARLLSEHWPSAVINFAAESHVDRSILGPEDFVQTNVVGTFRLLEATRSYYQRLSEDAASNFRFLHFSTDEVYGSLVTSDPRSAKPIATNLIALIRQRKQLRIIWCVRTCIPMGYRC